jgi:hypothetical protein
VAKVSYEWVIEEIDEFGDISNVDHADSLAEALKRRTEAERGDDNPAHVDVALLRLEYDDLDGELARHYAYLRPDRTLPEIMETCEGASDGPNVPKRFHAEAARVCGTREHA